MHADAKIRITRVVNPDEIAAQIEPKMRNLGNSMAARAQRLVPKRTWALHDSITTETHTAGGAVITEVGAGNDDVDYAVYVELGTSRAAAQPYLRPAMLQVTANDFRAGRGPTTRGIIVAAPTGRARRRERGTQ